MKWYSGSIAEAVQFSKQNGAVFFVAVFGDDEESRKLEEAVLEDGNKSMLSSDRYVCIRLTAESQEHHQFRQIYSNAQSPCLYFISLMGTPVEVINGQIGSDDLKVKCESAWSKHEVIQSQSHKPDPAPSQSVPGGASGTPEVPSAATGTSNNPIPSSGATTNSLSEQEQTANLTLEEKIERARQLAAARAQLKLEEEAEEARRREKERREAGKGMAELKRWQEEQEAKKLVEERKREKREEQLLRQKLREQIAQDRAERNKRSNASIVYEGGDGNAVPSTSSAHKPSVMSSSPANYAGKSRLQFRMPDGSSQTHAFEQDETLGNVHQFLIDGQYVKFSRFSLFVAYPRREFTSGEYSKTLKELGLLPSSTLLVIPQAGTNPLGAVAGGGLWAWLSTLLGYLLLPVTLLFGAVQAALPSTGANQTQSPSSSTSANPRENRQGGASAGSTEGEGGPSPNNLARDLRKRNVEKKADGNIHRLRNQESDSDDDQGTWNGNSTQQKPR